jgi:hypothetical protein
LRELVGDCGKGEGATLSYAAQDWEGMLREVKRMWGDIERHDIFNLQHNGVAAGLAAGVNGATAASELTYIETRALRMGGDGVALVVAASHIGEPPQPFDTGMLSEPAEVQWILLTDSYAPERESDERRKLAAKRAKHNSRRAWMRGAWRAGSRAGSRAGRWSGAHRRACAWAHAVA